MFCIASANAKMSRSQSLACDIGVRNKPSAARGPKLTSEMRQPPSTITAGVRQPMVEMPEAEGDATVMVVNPDVTRRATSAPKNRTSEAAEA
jgi:hypothetical protein